MRLSLCALVIIAGSLCSVTALGQTTHGNEPRTELPETVGQPFQGAPPIIETVDQIMRRELMSPVVELSKPRSMVVDAKRAARIAAVNPPVDESRWAGGNAPPQVPFWPYNPATKAVLDGPSGFTIGGNSFDPAAIGINFLATTRANANPGYVPPDTHGSVGPTQIIVHVNGSIRLFSKTGVLGALNASSDVFFNSVRAGGAAVDPRTYYDPISQRWFVSAITTTSPNIVMLAVSNGPTITSTSSFAFYGWVQDSVGGGAGDNGALFDYPSLGVDRNAVYIGGNVFGTGTPSVFVVRKSSVLSGGPIVVTAFRQLGNMNAPMGCSNTSLTSNFGYFIGSGGNGLLNIRRISDPGGTPTISAAIPLTVPSTAAPLTVPQAGGGSPLSGVDQRLIGAQILRNQFSTSSANDRTMWCSHNIQVNSSGVGGTGTRNGIRWYQIGNLDVTPTLVQSGTVFDNAATNQKYYWMGMVAMNGQGHAAVAGSVSSAITFPNVAVAGRLRTDPLGSIGAPQVATAAPGTYNAGTGTQRWGDYAAVALDPADEQTLWGFAEWSQGGVNWGVQVVQLTAPAPSTPSSATPSSIARGSTANIQINGTSVAGTEYYNTEDVNANKLNVSFSGSGITVNSVTWGGPNFPNRLTANITVSPSATTGGRAVTVTNPDGQSAVSTSPLLTITNSTCAADFNSDTVVDFFDYLDFVAAFSSNAPSADFNADTTIDFFDYLDFVAAFSNGC